jgi:hypothetical protein
MSRPCQATLLSLLSSYCLSSYARLPLRTAPGFLFPSTGIVSIFRNALLDVSQNPLFGNRGNCKIKNAVFDVGLSRNTYCRARAHYWPSRRSKMLIELESAETLGRTIGSCPDNAVVRLSLARVWRP